MSAFDIISIPVTRAGTAVPNSPFDAKTYLTSDKRTVGQVLPAHLMSQPHRVISFIDPLCPVQVGDYAALPWQPYCKLITTRRYSTGVQCDIQNIPFTALNRWTAKVTSQSVLGDGSLQDPAFTVTVDTLGFIEPASDQDKMVLFGSLDTRAAYLYTMSDKLAINDIVRDSQGDLWQAMGATEYFAYTGDYKTMMKHLQQAPIGVS